MALWTPSQITTALWLDASDPATITEISGAVSQWNDKSPTGSVCSQSAPSSRPVVSAAALNGLNVITFDGSGDFLTSNASIGNSSGAELNIFVVGAQSSGTNGVFLSNRKASATEGWTLRNNSTTQMTYFHVGGSPSLTKTTPTGAYICEVERDGLSVALGSNGDFDSPSSISSYSGTSQALVLGAENGGAASRLDGYIAEVVVSSGLLTLSDRQKVEGYLAWKWGIESSLPALHPYKSAAPTVGGPTITSQPANESVSVGDTAEFTVAATGTGTLSYQWKNGADDTSISGATSATYSFTAALPDNGKTYYCTVTDDDGSIDSNTVTLTVSASSTYTPTLADANKVLRFTAASPEVTIPTNASVAFPIGTILTIRQAGTGTLTLVTTGLTINGTVPSWAQHVEVQLRKVGTDEWDVT